VLQIDGTGFTGDLSSSVSFTCEPWTTELENTDATLTLNFANSIVPAFTGSTAVTCRYIELVLPNFATTPEDVALVAETPSSWTLPAIVPGSNDFSALTFTPPTELASHLTFDAVARTVTFDGLEITHLRAGSYVGTFRLTNVLNREAVVT